MMLLPIETRCSKWMEYYSRLDDLTKRQHRIEAAAAFLSHHPDRSNISTSEILLASLI